MIATLITLSIIHVTIPDGKAEMASVSRERVQLDVQYGPTPSDVIEEMLRIAQVKKDDRVYDLGCGDGRIVITAAEKTGASGIGIDIDPKRIRQSIRNAEKARVTDRVHFIQQDLFDADIQDATVVMIFLNPAVNIKVRPKLLRELKPGTRLVSHHHTMGTWKPDSASNIDDHPVYLWVIPASLEGDWELSYSEGNRQHRYTLHTTQTFQEFQGSLSGKVFSYPIEEARLSGDTIEFSAALPENAAETMLKFQGRIQGDTMAGTFQQGSTTYQWKAHRIAAATAR